MQRSETIRLVRCKNGDLQNAGRGSDVRFALGEIELEFVVDATRTAGGEASIKVLD
jgi:Trypsin-co-occurring domain 2